MAWGATDVGAEVPGAARHAALRASPTFRDAETTLLHQVVRGHLSSFLAEAAERGGLPRFVERDFARYLACGVLAHGFARLACAARRSEVLMPFSCKSRGVCPSCNARRAHDTAVHLVERVLPRAAYRQWTLSLPIAVRFALARDARLLSEVLGLFVRALFAFQRRTARQLGVSRPLTGAVAFVQRFGSALQLTPHFHVLVPEAVFEEVDEGELRPHPLPRPTDSEVEMLAVTVARRVLRLCHARGVLEEEAAPDGALDLLQLEGIHVPRRGPPPPARRPGRRCAFVEGFSLHADTWLHENDVAGLERLCSYGARGPLSLERLSALADGRLAYRMKRPTATGQTHLVLAPVAFLRRVAALVPPPRANLVRYFGVFAPNARVRPRVVPAPRAPATPRALSCPVVLESVPPRRPVAPSPGPSSSGGHSTPTSSPAPAAGAHAAWWPSSFAPPLPRPSSSTSGFPPGRSPSLPPPPRPSSPSGECRPSLETPALTTGPGVLSPSGPGMPAEDLQPDLSRPLPDQGRQLPVQTPPRKPRLFFLGSVDHLAGGHCALRRLDEPLERSRGSRLLRDRASGHGRAFGHEREHQGGSQDDGQHRRDPESPLDVHPSSE